MSPKKAKKSDKRSKRRKEARARREKRAEKKTSLRDEIAALTARVEALEARVEGLCAAPEPVPQSDAAPLTSVSGIGPKYAERLTAAGVASVTDLVEADPELLAERTGISNKTIQGWIDAVGATSS